MSETRINSDGSATPAISGSSAPLEKALVPAAQIKTGNRVDEFGRVRTHLGGFTDGVSRTLLATGAYSYDFLKGAVDSVFSCRDV
jgi:hypothetical protein